jgi:hypothetical protein
MLWRRPDGTSVEITAKFTVPACGSDGRWSCFVSIDGIDNSPEEVAGGSSMQAVKLALDHLSSRMRYLLNKGEVLSFVDEPDDHWDEEAIHLVFGGTSGSNFSSKPTP